MNIRYMILVAVIGLASLTGCASGGEASVRVQGTTTVTTGQELQDLQRALNEGAITPKEYDAVKAILLRRSK